MAVAQRITTNQDLLRSYGITVEDANGNLKSTYEVLKELKPVWDTMTDAERTSVGTALAGSNQFKVLSAVMQNFETAVSATTTALNSQGSAMQENEKAMTSLEAKTNLLKAEWEDFSNEVISSELVSFVLGLAEGGLSALNTELGQMATTVGLVTAAVAGLWAILKPMLTAIAGFAAANPVSVVVGVTLGLVSSLISLGTEAWAVRQSMQETTQQIEAMKAAARDGTALSGLTGEAAELNEQLTSVEDNIKSVVEEAGFSASVADQYVDRLEELNTQLELSDSDYAELRVLVTKLNSLYPSLNLSIDSTTKKLNQHTEAIREQITAYKTLAMQQAITQGVQSQYSILTGAEVGKAQAQEDLSIASGKLSVVQSLRGDSDIITQEELDLMLEVARLKKLITDYDTTIAQAQRAIQTYTDQYGEYIVETAETEVTALTDEEIEARKTAFENAQKFYEAKYKLGEMTEEEYYTRMYGLAQYYYRGQSELLSEWADEYSTYTKWKAKKDAEALEAQEQADADALQAKKDAYEADLQTLQEYYEDGGYGEYGSDVAESRYQAAVYERAKQAFAEGVIDEHDFHDVEFAYQQYLKALSEDMEEAAIKAQEKAREARINGIKEGYAEEKRLLDNQLATYEITEEEYYERLYQLAVKYYKDQEGLEEEWQDAQDDYAEKRADQAFEQAKENYALDAKALKEQLENNEITEGEYYAKLKELAEIYFGALPGYAEYYKSILDDILEEEQEAIEEATEATIEDAKTTYNQLLDFIDEQIEAQESLLKANEEAQKAIDEKYDKQLEDLKATNEALEDEIEYQELLNDLAKAKSEKVMVWKDGRFQQVEDYQAVADATAKLAEADRKRAQAAEEAEIEAQRQAELASLITEADKIQAGIDKWEAYKDTLDEVALSVDNLADATLALNLATGFASATTDAERQAVIDNYVSAYTLAHPTSSIFDNATGYASGTLNSTSGLHLFGEQGAELGVIGAYNGVLPSDITANLWDWGSMTPSSLLSALAGESGNLAVSIGSAQFPNVHSGADAESFVTSLRNLAYQAARSRVRS